MDRTIRNPENIVNAMEKMCILCGAMTKRANTDPALLDLKLLQMFDALYTTQSVTRTADLLGPEPAHGQHLARQAAPAVARPAVRAHAGRHAADAAGRHPRRAGARNPGIAAPPFRMGADIRAGHRAAALPHLHDRCEPHHAIAAIARACACDGAAGAARSCAHRRQYRARPASRAKLTLRLATFRGLKPGSTSRRCSRKTGCASRIDSIRESARQ